MAIPQIKVPGLSQEGFQDAFQVLEECRIDVTPVDGFIYPFFAPGGLYGPNWWNIDSALALDGYKWKDRAFAEKGLLNFVAAQKRDGRIKLYGPDHVPGYDEDISSLPKLFGVAYRLASESSDENFVREAYGLICRYLGWWLAKRRDAKTGLFSAVFEETFVPWLSKSGERAAVDTNVEIAVGCRCAALLAKRLKDAPAEAYYKKLEGEIAAAINKYLWWEEKGGYYAFDLRTHRHEDFHMASCFLPLRLGIAPRERAGRLIEQLTDDSLFGWDTFPVTSASKKDPQFTVTEGDYQFNASWSGSVWTTLNVGISQGLAESGYTSLAADLVYKTVCEFHGKYTEFLQPFNGSGHGVKRYAWTAAQYIQLIVEFMFGIRADGENMTVSLSPHLPERLAGQALELEGLALPDGGTLSAKISDGKIAAEVKNSAYKLAEGQNL